jgi:hypothetical protein
MSDLITDKETQKEDLRNQKFDRIACNILPLLSDIFVKLEAIDVRLQALEKV